MFHQEGNKWKEGKYEEQLYYKITQLVFFSRDCCSFCVVLSQWVLLRAEGCWILKKKSTRVKLLSVSFQHKGAAAVSELLNPVSKAEPSHSAEETHFGCFNSWSHFLAHDWRLRMIVGQKLCIPARLPFYHIGSAPHQASLSVSRSIFFFYHSSRTNHQSLRLYAADSHSNRSQPNGVFCKIQGHGSEIP